MVPVGYRRIILPARRAGWAELGRLGGWAGLRRRAGWAGLRRLAGPAAEASQQRAAGAVAVPAAAP
ncbi:MAG: hypothetical protein QOG05_2237 [Streptosporangiaceae bacterium]|jgi:hypothetical protein|nr:hypothetical protein [Streptosporangiaceae bacterium]